jgi:hypothetical protein
MFELTTKQIKEQLSRYLTGDLEPAEFRDWFALVLRDVHKSTDQNLEELAHEIEWAFCDLDRGVPSEKVRDALAQLLNPQTSTTFVLGQPMLLGGGLYSVATSGASSSTLLTGAAVASMGRPQVLHETLSA